MIKVLVIDDDEGLPEMVTLMLQSQGIDVQNAVQDEQLLDMLNSQQPNVF